MHKSSFEFYGNSMNTCSLQEASKTVETFMLYKYTVCFIFICYNRFSFQIHAIFQSFYSPSNPEKAVVLIRTTVFKNDYKKY